MINIYANINTFVLDYPLSFHESRHSLPEKWATHRYLTVTCLEKGFTVCEYRLARLDGSFADSDGSFTPVDYSISENDYHLHLLTLISLLEYWTRHCWIKNYTSGKLIYTSGKLIYTSWLSVFT